MLVNVNRDIRRRGRRLELYVLFFALLIILTSCSTLSPDPTPTTTPSPLPTTSTATPTQTSTPLPSPTPTPAPDRASYILNTTIDYDAHTVTVDETILYPNNTGQQLNSLVIALVPNLWDGCFSMSGIAVNDTPLSTYTVNGQRMDVTLPAMFMPGTVMKINIQYSLDLPFAEQEDPSISRPRIFGYTRRQMNLTNWYPFVVPFINGEWVLHEPWYYGEHLVYDAADYEVNLKFADPASMPLVAASGFPEQQDDFVRYTISSARTFALSASREFKVSTMQTGDVILSSYYFPFNDGGGLAALQASAEALQVYSQWYGLRYPHKTLSLVMGDFNDGMEFSAFFYLSRDFYGLYDGTPANYLTFVAVHETAHQWWFEQVANDQALQPWLDESLATYSERIYYENFYPDLVSWWWSYRIDFYNPQGFADMPVYDGQGFRPYTNAVYFRGAHFLEDLRARIGEDAFFAFLQDYLAQGNGKIVTANDFFRILSAHTSTDYSDLIRQYFQNVY
jgi:hypothetical protein